ncbi:hypothetical protein ABT297_23275 [Dactylosporangium sp. NPDC000555]|uniref:hypothetical protein n=1 Tax=Dactylosporangium sp. NPDC000555 TaxID=3154260 RepID=UPI0033183F3A
MQAKPRGTMHGWTWRANLLPSVETIADLVRFRVDDGALTAGIERPDADNDSFPRTRTDDTALVDGA